MRIAVFGATGMIGKPVISALVNAGFQVKALVRDLQVAQFELPQGVELIKGNLQNPEDISNLLKDVEAIYVSLSVLPHSKKNDFQPERDGLALIIREAERKNIKCIGYLSSLVQQYGKSGQFNWWVFDIKNRAVEKIENSKIPSLIFRPSTFMESYDQGGYRQVEKIALAGKGKHKMFMIAGQDYGSQVARAFKVFDGVNKEYIIQGRQGYTSEEGARIFTKYYNKEKLPITKASLGLLRFIGLFSQTVNYGAKILQALNEYPEELMAEKTWEALGKPKLTLKDYAENK